MILTGGKISGTARYPISYQYGDYSDQCVHFMCVLLNLYINILDI